PTRRATSSTGLRPLPVSSGWRGAIFSGAVREVPPGPPRRRPNECGDPTVGRGIRATGEYSKREGSTTVRGGHPEKRADRGQLDPGGRLQGSELVGRAPDHALALQELGAQLLQVLPVRLLLGGERPVLDQLG